MKNRLLILCAVLCFLAAGLLAWAGWPSDPLVNVALCNAANDQGVNGVTVAANENGGAIVAWYDPRSGDVDIYAQRIDLNGEPQWPPDGVPLCIADDLQLSVTGVGDGEGGAIFVWVDMRGGEADLYAQRVDSDGAIMWPMGSPAAGGVAVCTTASTQSEIAVVSDREGGAIVSWRHGVTADDGIFAQRLSPSGELLWPTGTPSLDGTQVCFSDGVQYAPDMVADGAGGAVIAWTDGRTSPDTNFDIYAQRINGDGSLLWSTDVLVCTHEGAQRYPAVAASGSGGAFISWVDQRGSSDIAIWAQYVSAGGGTGWIDDGIMLGEDVMTGGWCVRAAGDGRGGAVVVWQDLRNYTSTGIDLYAQHLDASGIGWADGGIALCTAGGDQGNHDLGSPTEGSVVVAWADYRNDSNADLYAQRFDDGVRMGPVNGMALSTAVYSQNKPQVGHDGKGSAVIAWQDWRNLDSGADIYVQSAFSGLIFADGFDSGGFSGWSAAVP